MIDSVMDHQDAPKIPIHSVMAVYLYGDSQDPGKWCMMMYHETKTNHPADTIDHDAPLHRMSL